MQMQIEFSSSKDQLLLQTLPEEDCKGSEELLILEIAAVVAKENEKSNNRHWAPTQGYALYLYDQKILL